MTIFLGLKNVLVHPLRTSSTSTSSRIFQQSLAHRTSGCSTGTTTVRRRIHATSSTASMNSSGGSTTSSSGTTKSSTSSSFWNREESLKGKYASITQDMVQREARIISLSDPNDDANKALHRGSLGPGATLLGVGTTLQDFDNIVQKEPQPNVLYVSPSCPMARVQLPLLLTAFPSIQWVHCRSAGIDFIVSEELNTFTSVQVTNAKGQFSSTLAEYTMMACSYFAKDLPRLYQQKQQRLWQKYDVQELRGSTMGIVGYGDIGRACAKLAKVYGMRVIALRRNPQLCEGDPLCDEVYGSDKDSLNLLMSHSDYVVCSAPSTVETRGMIDANAFRHAKTGLVFINLGRGPVVDETALIHALSTNQLRGAALDVFVEEPLPSTSPLWDLPNVLLSPHNMDQTATFMHEACEFFVYENLPRFICGEPLLNPVDKQLGY